VRRRVGKEGVAHGLSAANLPITSGLSLQRNPISQRLGGCPSIRDALHLPIRQRSAIRLRERSGAPRVTVRARERIISDHIGTAEAAIFSLRYEILLEALNNLTRSPRSPRSPRLDGVSAESRLGFATQNRGTLTFQQRTRPTTRARSRTIRTRISHRSNHSLEINLWDFFYHRKVHALAIRQREQTLIEASAFSRVWG